jgi:curved DNA-binding protein CbpA
MEQKNPLLVLAIPTQVLLVEAATENWSGVLELAESIYKTLVKTYHPDRGGNEELMTLFTEAIKELREPDAVEFYAQQLVGEQDIQGMRQQQLAQKLIARDTAALRRLSEGFAFIDQFALLGITTPTSYFAALGAQRLVIDVTTPKEARIRTTALDDITDNLSLVPEKTAYESGAWSESYLDKDYKRYWYQYGEYVSDEKAKLVGFVSAKKGYKGSDYPSEQQMIESTSGQVRLAWQDPQDCWFLSSLLSAENKPAQAYCVLYCAGKFAVTGHLFDTAAM